MHSTAFQVVELYRQRADAEHVLDEPKNQGGHTEAIKSSYELRLIPAKLVPSGRRKIIKLAVGGKFASILK